MNSLKQFAATTIFGALACAGVQAQNLDVKAKIPFAFSVGQTRMPAGNYAIRAVNGQVIAVQSDDFKHSVLALTHSAGSAGNMGEPRLQFHRYGNTYFLTAILNPGSGDARELPATHREEEIARRIGGSVEAMVIGARK